MDKDYVEKVFKYYNLMKEITQLKGLIYIKSGDISLTRSSGDITELNFINLYSFFNMDTDKKSNNNEVITLSMMSHTLIRFTIFINGDMQMEIVIYDQYPKCIFSYHDDMNNKSFLDLILKYDHTSKRTHSDVLQFSNYDLSQAKKIIEYLYKDIDFQKSDEQLEYYLKYEGIIEDYAADYNLYKNPYSNEYEYSEDETL